MALSVEPDVVDLMNMEVINVAILKIDERYIPSAPRWGSTKRCQTV